ncbi:hypothetical protein [Luteolibacter soli]|uniref:Uncharacterized protein n=1 Tax=Luteolibacter soli TaxID=3135280 RepID=A0ABU9B064_9BACT
MDPDNHPLLLALVLRIVAFICGFATILLVLGAFGSTAEMAKENFSHAFMCVASLVGLLWMAAVLELLHKIAGKKNPPEDE